MEIRTLIQIIFALFLIIIPVHASEIELTGSEFVIANLSTGSPTGDLILNASGSPIQVNPSNEQYVIEGEYCTLDQIVSIPDFTVLDSALAPIQSNPAAWAHISEGEYNIADIATVIPGTVVLDSAGAPIQSNPAAEVHISNSEYFTADIATVIPGITVLDSAASPIQSNPAAEVHIFNSEYFINSTVVIPDTSIVESGISGDYDLAAASLSWLPSNFSDGDTVTFTARITNIGSGNATGLFYVKFYMDGTQIGEKYVAGLAPNSSLDLNQVWPAAPGEHIIKVVIDPYNYIKEINENNNEYSKNLMKINLPDLIISNLTLMPSSYSDGQVVKVAATVKNIGASTSRDFFVAIKNDCDCAYIGKVRVSGLASGEEKVLSVFWIGSSGYNLVSAVVDPEGYILEFDDSNNNMSLPLPPILQPDLVVTDVRPSHPVINDSDSVTFNVTIANIGPGNTSKNSVIQLTTYDDCECGQCIQRMLIPGLEAGESITVEMLKPWTAAFGLNKINVTVDANGNINEVDEGNNVFNLMLPVNDIHAPAFNAMVPANGTIAGNISNITLRFSDKLGSGVDLKNSSVTVKRGAEIIGVTATAAVDTLLVEPDANFMDGNYLVLIDVVDYVGNHNQTSSSFIVDTLPPVINVSGVVEGGNYQTPVSPSVEVSDLHLSSSSITVNGKKFTSGAAISNDGNYILTATAVDKATNQASKTVHFKVDVKPVPPTGLNIYREDVTADLSWNPNLEADIAGYNVYRDGMKQNTDLIVNMMYRDTNLIANRIYNYTVTAVDLAGHESEGAGVNPIRLTLTEYGTRINDKYYLTGGFPDSVKFEIYNNGDTFPIVDRITLEAVDGLGRVTSQVSNDNDFSIPPYWSKMSENIIMTGNDTSRVRIKVYLKDDTCSMRDFKVNVRKTPSYPVEITAPTLMEGYRDSITVKFTNFGSSRISINTYELIVDLKANGKIISEGYGGGSWKVIEPNTSAYIPAIIVTPMAVGNLSLENLTLDVKVPTYYVTITGKETKGNQYNLSKKVNHVFQTVSPIEIYNNNIVKGGTTRFDLAFINQGTSDLTINQGNVIVYIKDKNGSLLASGVSQQSTGTVLPSSVQKFSVNIKIPPTSPDIVIVEAVIKANHFTRSGKIDYIPFKANIYASTILPEYNANAAANRSVYNMRDKVAISGKATYNNGTIVPDASVKLTISNNGYRREFLVRADSQGKYTYIFTPLSTEAGKYYISATHPGVWSIESDAEFEILGLYVEPLPGNQLQPYAPPVNLGMSQSTQKTVSVYVRNLGESNLTNVQLSITDENELDEVEVSPNNWNFDLPKKSVKRIDVTVTAGFDTPDTANFVIKATSGQIAASSTTLSVKLYTATPRPRIDPGYLQTGANQGGMQVKTVTIINTGYQALRNVTIGNSSLPWISPLTNKDFGDVAAGGSRTFDIMIAPGDDVQSGVYETNIEITSSNYIPMNFPIRVFVTSAKTGDLKFTVKNQVYDVLPGAEVAIVDQDTYTLRFTGKTDTNGEVIFSGIPVGRYQYRVDVPQHEQVIGNTMVEMGTATDVSVITSFSFLKVEWSVVPTTIKDVYEITHEITYDTKAPVPYIKMDSVREVLYIVPGAVYYGNVTITNMNDIVSVLNARPVGSSNHELATIEFLIDNIPELKPHENITIPYAVKLATHHSPTARPCDKISIAVSIETDEYCIYGLYEGEVKPENWVRNVNTTSITDIKTIEVHPSCIDFMLELPNCLTDICSYFPPSAIACKVVHKFSEAFTISDTSLISRVSGCIETASDCLLQNSYCNKWQEVDCFTGFYSCIDAPLSSCLSAANSFARCAFDAECCTSEPWPVTQNYYPPRTFNHNFSIPSIGLPSLPTINLGYPATQPPLRTITLPQIENPSYNVRLPDYSSSPYVEGPCNHSAETMCTKVKLEIKQELTLERQGFDAMLALENIQPDYDMTNVSITVNITDSNGNLSNDLFFMNITSLTGMQNIDSGSLDSGQSTTMHWLIIPTPGAGGTDGIKYTVQAKIKYTVKGVEFTLDTWPDQITVKPMPKLTLDYVLPGKVYGDDPMTQGIIEPVVPFMFGVRVENSGYGPAYNLAIDSAQPRIVESTPGVMVDFALIGTYVNGWKIENTLNIPFGTLPPQSCSAAGWAMTSSVTGNFSNYSATFKHSDALGGAATSLIEEIRTHTLVHEFMDDRPGKDYMFDFLIDNNSDGLPDRILDSQCDDLSISSVTGEMIDLPTFDVPMAHIMLNASPEGWVYVTLEDLSPASFKLLKIERSDGKVVDEYNFWTRDGKIQFVDYYTTGMYTAFFQSQSTLEITDITITNITDHSAIVEWNTTIPADTLVRFGTESQNYSMKKYFGAYSGRHRIVLSGLSADTTYYYAANSTDQSKYAVESIEQTFRTLLPPDTVLPVITVTSPVNNSTYASDTVDLNYTVNEPTGWAGYSLNGASNITLLGNTTLPVLSDGSHTLEVYAVDISGNTNSTSVRFSVDTTPPAGISNLQYTSGRTWINWTWENPAASDFSHSDVYLSSGLQTSIRNHYLNVTDLVPNTEYTIHISTVDNLGNKNNTWVEGTATTLGAQPVCLPAGPYSASEGQPVVFDGSASYDPDPGDLITGYEWDFNNDGLTDATGMVTKWVWYDDFAGQVSLTVTDSFDYVNKSNVSVTIRNVPPVAEAGSDLAVDEGDTVSFSGNFSDAGTSDTHTVVWDFGDGTIAQDTLEPGHIYADNGNYTVTFNVTDDDGAYSSDTLAVTVENVAPLVEAEPVQAVEWGNNLSVSIRFIDPGDDEWEAEIDYGDGSPIEIGPVYSKNIAKTHVYSIPGEYLIKIQIRDDDGGIGTEILPAVVTTRSTDLTFTGELSGQYSDPLLISVRLETSANKYALAGRSINITFAGQAISAATNSEGIGSALFSSDLPAGNYDIISEFSGDDLYSPAVTVQSISIIPEDIEIIYTGDIIIPTSSEYINLRATLNEIDPYFGNLNNLKVDFAIFRSDDYLYNDPVASELSVPVVSSGQGIGTAAAAISNLPQGNYSLVATIAPNEYYRQVSSAPAAVMVYEPDGSFVTGGGWIWGTDESHENFGFTMKYDKTGNTQGNLMYTYQEGGFEYKLKSNSVIGVAINRNLSIFQGRAYLEIYDTLNNAVQPGGGEDFQFIVEAVDNDFSNKLDTYKIMILDVNGSVYHEAEGELQGGNIKIHDNREVKLNTIANNRSADNANKRMPDSAANTTADVTANTTADSAANTTADVAANTTADVAANTTADVAANTTADSAANATADSAGKRIADSKKTK